MKKLLFFSLVCLSSVCFAKFKPDGYEAVYTQHYDYKTNTIYVTEYTDSIRVWYHDDALDSTYSVNMHISKFNKAPELRALKAEIERAVRNGKAHVLK